MFSYRSFSLLALLATPLAHASVIVGHPVPLEFAPGAGLTFTSGSISVTDEKVEFCDATVLTIPIDDVLVPGDLILLPEGEICGVELLLDAPTLLSGTGNSGGSFSLTLLLASVQIAVDPSLVVSSSGTSDADGVQLAFPDWITATSLELGPGITRTITSSSGIHNTLRNDIKYGSSILR